MDIDGNIDAQLLEIYIYKWHLDFGNNKIADVFFFFLQMRLSLPSSFDYFSLDRGLLSIQKIIEFVNLIICIRSLLCLIFGI